jgi:hypothetical protein
MIFENRFPPPDHRRAKRRRPADGYVRGQAFSGSCSKTECVGAEAAHIAPYFLAEGHGAPQGAQAPAKSSGDTARPADGLVR